MLLVSTGLEPSDAAKYPMMHRTAPPPQKKNYMVQSNYSAKVEKPCSPESFLAKVMDNLIAKSSGLCRALILLDLSLSYDPFD